MNWYLSALKKYAVFSGRARRKEYWFFQLFNTIIMTVLIVIDNVTGIVGPGPSPGMPGAGFPRLGLLSGLFCLAVFLPSLGVLVRRLHDTNRSGWWILIGLVPFIGGIVLLIFALLDSDPQPNQYGPNPKAASPGSMPGSAAVHAG